MNWKLSVCNMNRKKLCEQYDSELKPEGQAYDIVLTTEITGWKEITFTLPQTINGRRNFRWDFIRSGYLLRLERDSSVDWYLLQSPRRSHKGQTVTMSVICEHVCSQLNTKAMNFVFDDTNGIGTAKYLVGQVLSGTGWQLGECETFLESDGKTEKVRSISSDGKRGAYLLISDICKMFGGRPVYDGDTRTVHIYSLNRHDDCMELSFGKNLDSVERTEDASNIVTRLYVEGEYSDGGYVGIDEVNPTGLPFLLNFDYYRELGVFTEEHEQALAEYLQDIAACKERTNKVASQLIAMDGDLSDLWGQIDYVLYLLEDGNISRFILGGEATNEQASLSPEDTVTILFPNGTHITQPGGEFPTEADLAIKWIQRASAVIGGKEVAIEAKQEMIARLQKQLDKETDPQKRQGLVDQIAAQEKEIEGIYNGTEGSDGLYTKMRQAVELAVERATVQESYNNSMDEQSEIERRFAAAMGDMLRDGYWSNTSYAPGQEGLLYLEASDVMEELSKPTVTYSVSVKNLSGVAGYEQERFTPNMALRIWDETLGLNDWAYVTKQTENPEAPEKDTVTISNDLSSLGGISLDSVIAKITGIAEIVNQRKALYDRSAAISPDGTIPAKRLEGTIDVLRTRLSSAISNWYTDNNGNLILEAVNGSSAMQLCGDGFMIANQKTDDGNWDWRTFGTGEGFTADMIVTGFLSADRIGAHAITANKLAADVGESLDLSSNKSIRSAITQNMEEALNDIEIGGANLIVGSASYTLIASGTDSYWIAVDELMSGRTYTLSVQEVELEEGQAPGVTWKIVNRDTNVEQQKGMLEITYGRQVTSFTLPEEEGNWALYLYAGESGNTLGNTVVFRKIKLEEGSVATAWSLSQDELSSSIGELKSNVEELDENMESRVMMLIDSLGLSDRFASAEEFLKALSDINLIRSEMEQYDSSLSQTFSRLAAAENSITQIFSSIVFGDDNGVPYLDMRTSESQMKMRLTNTKLSFMQADSELAYFSDNKLYVTRLEAVEQISIGTAVNGYLDIVTTPMGVGFKWRSQ